jgi:hypothetical protein
MLNTLYQAFSFFKSEVLTMTMASQKEMTKQKKERNHESFFMNVAVFAASEGFVRGMVEGLTAKPRSCGCD